MKNKKADIPVTILVIGVFAICALAIVSFLSSSFNFSHSFTGISEMEEMNSKIDEYYFYKNAGLSEEKIQEILDIKEGSLYIEKNPTKSFSGNCFWRDSVL
ncbi:unnamed protein product [marine sediment metagenome]|uniref:Uncharacterized protein n=1 Tax=marine sediment metagenome TaxID=412755 RepID=X1RJC7_9ZZZZ